MDAGADELLAFWFGPLDADGLAGESAVARWFGGGPAFDVIARFGRFPHRNAALDRATTEAERAHLAEEGGF